jgi:N,N'-diacetyllegionaminate synthase
MKTTNKNKQRLIIIAEAGVNHNGNLGLAKKLVDCAALAGADFVKFQSFKADNLVTNYASATKYQIINLRKKVTQYNLLKKLELNLSQHKIILDYCKKKNIKFLSSVFDLESLEILKFLKVKNIKVPSGEINNYHLLDQIAKCAKKIFLSTGMSNLSEIKNALRILTKYNLKKRNIYLLHCVTSYPAPLNESNLLAMKLIEKKFGLKTGFSDHSIGKEVSYCAVCLGASIIEKHITTNNNLPGPDHKASMEFKEFKDFVSSLRDIPIILGNEKKIITKSESENKKFVRKSIVAHTKINKGDYFNLANITCKRPEGGIPPSQWDKVVGKKSKYFFNKDDFIRI